jgi:indolepyruvate ferredoxin oxidoreductase
VSHAMFTKVPHIFQNLGDGTYYHSGYLAIRQAIAANATLTYKILFNDAVAMTGGQPVDGKTSVQAIAQQVAAEGAARVAVLSDAVEKFELQSSTFPPGTTFHDRSALDAVQRELRATPGVTVLIYEQTCAAEKRRRRKKGELADPEKKLFINAAVCEGCGDCGVQSNCVAVLPVETPLGRKRRIDQSACNKDYSCAKGFCPSFVGVIGGQVRKRRGVLASQGVGRQADRGDARFADLVAALPRPAERHWTGPYDLLVTGVGGTGVVTVGALVAMAAHLEGKSASVLDFMGFAQKGGSVLSFVRLAEDAAALNQVRIDVQQADAVLGCDVVVAASPEALQTIRHGRTQLLVNVHEIPVAEAVHNPDADLRLPLLLDKLRFAAGPERVRTLDAQVLAEDFLGDSIYANIVALGHAWQLGLVPVSLQAMQRAIELNAVAVDANKAAFSLGRLHAHDAAACRALLDEPAPAAPETLDALVARLSALLAQYQDRRYAARFQALVQAVREREATLGGEPVVTAAVARSFAKLMAYKDEYEVARLYTDGEFERQLQAQFEGDFRLEFHMAPPALGAAKRRFGPWLLRALRVLARGKALRGSVFDPFGHSAERRLERALIDAYEARVHDWLPLLDAATRERCQRVAEVPLAMRGFGHVKRANIDAARQREAVLLHRLDAKRWPRPAAAEGAGQFRGIPVVGG